MRKKRSDAGKKRGTYVQKWRAEKRIGADLRRSLEEIKQRERVRHAESQKEYRRNTRLQLLGDVRKCDCCEQIKFETKKWVIVKNNQNDNYYYIICKSCWWIFLRQRAMCIVATLQEWAELNGITLVKRWNEKHGSVKQL